MTSFKGHAVAESCAAADRKKVAAPSRRVVGAPMAINACGSALWCHGQRLQRLARGAGPLRVVPAGRDGCLDQWLCSARWLSLGTSVTFVATR